MVISREPFWCKSLSLKHNELHPLQNVPEPHHDKQCNYLPESLSITHRLSPALLGPPAADESLDEDESSDEEEDDDESSDPAAAQNFDMIYCVACNCTIMFGVRESGRC